MENDETEQNTGQDKRHSQRKNTAMTAEIVKCSYLSQ